MDNKAFFCILIAFIFFLLLFQQGLFYESNDNAEHREMGRKPGYNLEYAPLLRSFSGWFAWANHFWFALILFLFVVITPLLLYKITNNWLAVPFYFLTTNYFYAIVGAGLYAQGLLVIFLLAMVFFKNNYVRLVLFFVGSLAHSTAPLLLGAWVLLLVFEENFYQQLVSKFKKKFPTGFVLGCSPIFGNNTPKVLQQEVSNVTGKPWSLNFGGLLSFFIKTCPLPFLLVAIKEWFSKKRVSFFVLSITAFCFSFFWNDRILLVIAPLMVVGFTNYYPRLNNKLFWWVLLLIFGLFHFQQYVWVVFAIGC